MDLPLRTVQSFIDKAASKFTGSVALGIDIGATSIKLVQLSRSAEGLSLDTYGTVELGAYADMPPGSIPQLNPLQRGGAALDLINAVKATTQRAALSIPFSASFVSVMTTPKRTEEQMRAIMPSEIKPFIPVPLESVTLDWQIIDSSPAASALEQAESKEAVRPEKQHVLIVAVGKKAVIENQNIARAAGLSLLFDEVEMFSAARGAYGKHGEMILLVDLGASGTKFYVLNEHGAAVAAHQIVSGGVAITEKIAERMGSDFSHAETTKRSSVLATEKAPASVIAAELARIFAEARRTIEEYESAQGKKISSVMLCGGGALLSSIGQTAANELKLQTRIAKPFAHAHGPIILADTLAEVGPLYAVAMGLALRALQ